MFYVYLLGNQNDKSWYIGFTSDLKQRIKEHQEGKGGRTTSLKNTGNLFIMRHILLKMMRLAEKSSSKAVLVEHISKNNYEII